MSDKKTKYFHKITSQEYALLFNQDLTWADVRKMYSQPDWCSYPCAVNGSMGCWSLMLQKIKSKEDCGNCDLCT